MGESRPRVAVIDDDPEFVALMEVLLEEEGFACLPPPAPNADVLASLIETRPDLAIVDLRGVSDDDGLGLVWALRNEPRLEQLPVLVCSADLQLLRARAAQLSEQPRLAVLEKPFRIDALLGAVERLLAGKAAAPVGGRPDQAAVAELERWLARTGRTLRWDALDAWVPGERPGQLRCVVTWVASDDLDAFARLTRRTHLPYGAGLPGRIWVSGRAAWIADLASDMNFPRLATARRLGLISAAAVPVFDDGDVVGVLAAYARRRRRSNAAALARLAAAADDRGPTFRAAAGS